MTDSPRRNDVNRQVFAEREITAAMASVENMGSNPLLTEAVQLLQQAQSKVADFVDAEISSGG